QDAPHRNTQHGPKSSRIAASHLGDQPVTLPGSSRAVKPLSGLTRSPRSSLATNTRLHTPKTHPNRGVPQQQHPRSGPPDPSNSPQSTGSSVRSSYGVTSLR